MPTVNSDPQGRRLRDVLSVRCAKVIRRRRAVHGLRPPAQRALPAHLSARVRRRCHVQQRLPCQGRLPSRLHRRAMHSVADPICHHLSGQHHSQHHLFQVRRQHVIRARQHHRLRARQQHGQPGRRPLRRADVHRRQALGRVRQRLHAHLRRPVAALHAPVRAPLCVPGERAHRQGRRLHHARRLRRAEPLRAVVAAVSHRRRACGGRAHARRPLHRLRRRRLRRQRPDAPDEGREHQARVANLHGGGIPARPIAAEHAARSGVRARRGRGRHAAPQRLRLPCRQRQRQREDADARGGRAARAAPAR
mmetsp:Transcript_45148/g.98157  ORF Transcript_45148/g.98157 Transcript_45148/m.98157 type:complete len:307 (+) Transcript_45148:640-1560(+)